MPAPAEILLRRIWALMLELGKATPVERVPLMRDVLKAMADKAAEQ